MMKDLNPLESLTLDQERSEALQQWEAWLEMPLLVLSFAWFGLVIIELIWGLNPRLVAIGITIWLIFIVSSAASRNCRLANGDSSLSTTRLSIITVYCMVLTLLD
jgi:hypothetical protein